MLELALWSAVTVFSELAIVRLFSTLVGGASYFGNLFLLVGSFAAACGLMAPRLGRFSHCVAAALLLPLIAAVALGRFDLIEWMPDEFFWSSIARTKPREASFDLRLGILLLAVSSLPALLLCGAVQGELVRRVREGAKAYLILAGGGLAGAALLAVQNQWLPSLAALVCLWSALVGSCWLLGTRGRSWLWLTPLIAALAIAVPVSLRSRWSPYQRIDLAPMPGGYAIHSNGFYISSVSNVPDAKLTTRFAGPTAWAFKSLHPGDNVLVVGSGAGTADVREALHAGAGHVTAVEIDPEFIQVGLDIDPDHTYRDPKVERVNADGRHFLASTDRQYDFILYPFVDSQTNASNQARFRLDSFLYTLEGLHLAYSHLAPRGIMIVNFATGTRWIQQRMYDLLRVATGREVRVFVRGQSVWSLYAVSNGRQLPDVAPFFTAVPPAALHVSDLPIPTDDWPFLYSLERRVPWEYLRISGMVLLLFAALLAGVTAKRWRESEASDWPAASSASPLSTSLLAYAFFSGAAFFFIELRTISALVPVFGSTYLSQSAAVIGIIACSLAGGLSAERRLWLPPLAAWLALFACLGLSYVAPDWFHPLWGLLQPSASLMLLALLSPVFFAGYLYLTYVRRLPAAAVASMQKWNLVGGAIGGLAECSLIVLGFRLSIWVALAFYCVAFVAATAHRSTARVETPAVR